MPNRIHSPNFSDLLRQALRQGPILPTDIERRAGVARQSIHAFLNGTASLRLDMADRLAQMLFSSIEAVVGEWKTVMLKTSPIGNRDDHRSLRAFISSLLAPKGLALVPRKGSDSWNGVTGRWSRRTLFKLSYLGDESWFFGTRKEFSPALDRSGRSVHQFVPQPVDFVGTHVRDDVASKAAIRQLIDDAFARGRN
jgi:hypothetical protein